MLKISLWANRQAVIRLGVHKSCLQRATCRLPNSPNSVAFVSVRQKRADFVGAEALYKRAGAIDPFHANSIYNYAVLLDSSLKQQEVG